MTCTFLIGVWTYLGRYISHSAPFLKNQKVWFKIERSIEEDYSSSKEDNTNEAVCIQRELFYSLFAHNSVIIQLVIMP